MKICPLCKTNFDDSAVFCPKCKAELLDHEEVEKAEKGKIPRSFWLTLLAVFAFIGGMVLIYSLVYSNLYNL